MQSRKNNRRDFLKKAALTSASIAAIPAIASCANAGNRTDNLYGDIKKDTSLKSKLIVPKAEGLKLSGVFIDEISHDIPHQNWGEAEWDLDFQYMKGIGIDTVIMIRAGYKKFITYPSEYLMNVDILSCPIQIVNHRSTFGSLA